MFHPQRINEYVVIALLLWCSTEGATAAGFIRVHSWKSFNLLACVVDEWFGL